VEVGGGLPAQVIASREVLAQQVGAPPTIRRQVADIDE